MDEWCFDEGQDGQAFYLRPTPHLPQLRDIPSIVDEKQDSASRKSQKDVEIKMLSQRAGQSPPYSESRSERLPRADAGRRDGRGGRE